MVCVTLEGADRLQLFCKVVHRESARRALSQQKLAYTHCLESESKGMQRICTAQKHQRAKCEVCGELEQGGTPRYELGVRRIERLRLVLAADNESEIDCESRGTDFISSCLSRQRLISCFGLSVRLSSLSFHHCLLTHSAFRLLVISDTIALDIQTLYSVVAAFSKQTASSRSRSSIFKSQPFPAMDHPTLVASPYLQDSADFQPSSSTSAQFDIPAVDSVYDPYTFESGYHQDNAHFPHTPSYNGSPFSQYSDLPSFGNGDTPDALNLFEDNPSGITISEEYDPAEYDLPDSSSLLTFDDSYMSRVDPHNPHVSITPPAYDRSSPTAYDHASPASSNGLEDDHLSRGSSSSSYMHPNSPPLGDFAANFESLHFESPNWSNAQLPKGDRSSPPAQKPQSPPQLVIPDIASPATTVHDEPPIINAPDGDGGMPSGPQLHIVPATPISGGGGPVQNVPFLQQG